MKLAILTQYYPPEVGAPQSRLSALAREFVRRGHQVSVLTAMPNYPTGRLHRGYRKMYLREERDGVRVIRTLIWPTQQTGFVPRLASYFSFVLSAALFGSIYLDAPDYILVESPPLFLGLTGVLLSRLKRARMVFNVSDLWPESAVRLGLLRQGSAAYRLGASLERFCYRHAWLVTGQSAEIVSDIRARFPSCATSHLSNGADSDAFGADKATAESQELLGKNGNCVALYAGLHGLAQGLELLVDGADSLPPDCHLDMVLIGDGPTKGAIVDRVKRGRIQRVRFLSPRPHRDMPAILAAADVLVVPLLRYIPGAVPSKLDAGMCVAPGDLAGLVQALRTLSGDADLRARLGANGRAAAIQFFDRKHIAVKFVELLERQLHPATGLAVENLVPDARQQPGIPLGARQARASASLSR